MRKMSKKYVSNLFVVAALLVLAACSMTRRNSSRESSSTSVPPSHYRGFKEESADKLLSLSSSIPYPDGKSFVATGLNNAGLAFGVAYDEGNESQRYLASLNLHTKEFAKIKDVELTSDLVDLVVLYTDEDIVVFEEYDSVNQTSVHYLWKIKEQQFMTLIERQYTPPIHLTQIARNGHHLYINHYKEDGLYQLHDVDIQSGASQLIEEQDNGSPVVDQGQLYYILIDNKKLTTSVIAYDEKTGQKKVLHRTKGKENYYSWMVSNGENRLYTLSKSDGTLSVVGEDQTSLFSTSYLDTPVYRGDFLTFLGERRKEERVKSQYYLLDIKHKVNYLYEGGPILISDKGILWIDFKKPDAEIPKGEIYRNENSVMRYLEWKDVGNDD